MNDLAVMYHYVKASDWKGIAPLTPENFILQLEWLTKNYEIVSPNDLGASPKLKPYCVLTFDDGTKDQYEVAFDILNRKGLPAYFTVMSGPLLERKIPIFHLVHTVLSFYADSEIWNELRPHVLDIHQFQEKSEEVYFYESNELRRWNKYALNFVIPEEQSRVFLETKVSQLFDSLDGFIEHFYISADEFKKMSRAGMTLGVHASHHYPFGNNSKRFYKSEIEPCRNYMKSRLGVTPRWYTPAFGGGIAKERMFSELEILLRENGFMGGFTTVPGFNKGLDNFWLNRFDCNSIPPLGKL